MRVEHVKGADLLLALRAGAFRVGWSVSETPKWRGDVIGLSFVTLYNVEVAHVNGLGLFTLLQRKMHPVIWEAFTWKDLPNPDSIDPAGVYDVRTGQPVPDIGKPLHRKD